MVHRTLQDRAWPTSSPPAPASTTALPAHSSLSDFALPFSLPGMLSSATHYSSLSWHSGLCLNATVRNVFPDHGIKEPNLPLLQWYLLSSLYLSSQQSFLADLLNISVTYLLPLESKPQEGRDLSV